MKKYTNEIVSFILAIFMTIFIWHIFLASANTTIFIFIFISAYLTIKSTLTISKKRNCVIAVIIATLYAIVEILCKSINMDYTLNNIFNKWILVNIIGYLTTGWVSTIWIFNLFEKIKLNSKSIINTKIGYFFLCFVLMLMAWFPYFLRYYPGIVTSDSCSQIEQSIGKIELSNHHPITHTGIIAIFIKLGLLFSNDINIGIALYSIASMITMAVLNSFVLLFFKDKKVPVIFRGATLLYYMFYPINAIYSITMWKDIFFSGILPIFIILNYKLIFETEIFIKSNKWIFTYVFVGIFTCLIRHNGLYVVIFTLPFLFIVLRKEWKKILPMFGTIIILYVCSNILIYNILGVAKGSVVEMLSIPTQQIARVEKEHRHELDTETIEEINKFFVVENIGDKYNPILSDPVKWSMNKEYFKENKVEFIKLWIKLLFKYPKNYIESFISNSYGYYYPEARENPVSTITFDRDMGIEQQPIIEWKIIDVLLETTQMRNIPIIFIGIYSIGTVFWLIVISFGNVIKNKEYKMMLLYVPIFVLWLTLIASPVYCEFRYAYPLFTTLPIFIALNLKSKGEENNGKNSSVNTLL